MLCDDKSLATFIQGKKNLNDLMSNQKVVVGKEGLGFSPELKKANKKKKMPTSPSKDIVFVKEWEPAKKKEEPIVGGKVTRGNATHNDFVGKYNP